MIRSDAWNGATQAFLSFKDVMFATGKAKTYEELARWADDNGESSLAEEARKSAADVDNTEADFNRLCIGPFRLVVPPYESVWRSRTRVLNNRYTATCRVSYAEVGLTIDPKLNEMPDYFGNELEFLYYIAALREKHLSAGHKDVAEALEDAGERFWCEHLGHWYGDFLDAMQKEAVLPFWKEWARVLKNWLGTFFNGCELTEFMTGLEQEVKAPASFKTRNEHEKR